MVATFFDVDYKIVEEGVVDEDLHIRLIESLTEEGGRRALLFMFQEMPPPPIGMIYFFLRGNRKVRKRVKAPKG